VKRDRDTQQGREGAKDPQHPRPAQSGEREQRHGEGDSRGRTGPKPDRECHFPRPQNGEEEGNRKEPRLPVRPRSSLEHEPEHGAEGPVRDVDVQLTDPAVGELQRGDRVAQPEKKPEDREHDRGERALEARVQQDARVRVRAIRGGVEYFVRDDRAELYKEEHEVAAKECGPRADAVCAMPRRVPVHLNPPRITPANGDPQGCLDRRNRIRFSGGSA